MSETEHDIRETRISTLYLGNNAVTHYPTSLYDDTNIDGRRRVGLTHR